VEGANAAVLETPSGKGRHDENFPVGSFLIRRDLRPHVHAFYRFARQADDIADNPALAPEEKVRRLERMGEVLEGAPGDGAPSAVRMRESLSQTGVTPQHCHDVLTAFKMDATKKRYEDWADLMNYCRYSASPVGRQLLDLHGELRETWAPSDALCSALQVLNHLQDCGEDYANLDRVYVPLHDLARERASIDDLALPSLTPSMRRVVDGLLDSCATLVEKARALPGLVASRGLRCESAIIALLAARLTQLLRRSDPLAGRVALRKTDFLSAGVRGTWWGLTAR
jgi:hydroxysqualene synthase